MEDLLDGSRQAEDLGWILAGWWRTWWMDPGTGPAEQGWASGSRHWASGAGLGVHARDWSAVAWAVVSSIGGNAGN